MGSNDVVLAVLPQFHVGGWNIQPLLAWWVGATVVLERGFDPGRVLQLIAERGVTMLMGVPTQYLMLAEHPDFAARGTRQPAPRRGGRGADAGAAAADLAPQGSGAEPGLRPDRGLAQRAVPAERGRRTDGRLLRQAVPARRRRGGGPGHRRNPRRRRQRRAAGGRPGRVCRLLPRPRRHGRRPRRRLAAHRRPGGARRRGVHQSGGPAQGHLHLRRRERGPGRGRGRAAGPSGGGAGRRRRGGGRALGRKRHGASWWSVPAWPRTSRNCWNTAPPSWPASRSRPGSSWSQRCRARR